jgi:hypothetical protein
VILKNFLTNLHSSAYNTSNAILDKPVKKKSNWQKQIYRELPAVGWEREAVSEWASEGSFERRRQELPVGADGTPPVIHRGTYDGTCSEWTFHRGCQFGWYRRSLRFCPIYGTEAFFYLASKKIQMPGRLPLIKASLNIMLLAKHNFSSAAQAKTS